MSLAVLADHMASKGRGPDSMLIHMSPREVQGLQALAVNHGGSLTINPETGLPEAGFLDKLLPAIIGMGISVASGGTIDPMTAAAMVGGFETVRTGDIGRGISAGFGAYGGAGLGASMMAPGVESIGALPTADAYAGLGANAITDAEALAQGFGSAEELMQTKAALAGREAVAAAGPLETLSKGFDTVTKSPSTMGQFAKDNFKYLAAGAAPMFADAGVKSNMPKTTTPSGEMRRFSYNPYGQTYTPTGNYKVPVTEAAGGGLMGMNDGGYSPGQLNFAERSEPVVRMAVGGQTVEELYKSIGNTNPDKEGLAFWTGNFGTGPVTAEQASSFMQSANAALAQRSPTEQLALAPILAAENAVSGGEYGRNLATVGQTGAGAAATDTSGGLNNLAAANNIANVTTGATAGATAAGTSTADAQTAVNNIYRNVLGRDADATGLNFWSNAIANGRSVDSVYQDILKSANTIKSAGTLGDFGIKTMTAADATKPYTGFTSTEGSTIADEFVRNVLGREPTAADRTQSWYKDAAKLGTTADASKVYSDFLKSAGTEASSNVAKKIADAKALLTSKGLTEADVLRQTGKTVAELVGSGANLNLGFMQAAQLKPLGSASTGFDFSTITKPKVASTFDTTNPYGNNTGNALTSTPGDLTRNADGTITAQPYHHQP